MNSTMIQFEQSYVLWHREDPFDRWQPIATADSTAELIEAMSNGPKGEYIDLPSGQRPSEGRGINAGNRAGDGQGDILTIDIQTRVLPGWLGGDTASGTIGHHYTPCM